MPSRAVGADNAQDFHRLVACATVYHSEQDDAENGVLNRAFRVISVPGYPECRGVQRYRVYFITTILYLSTCTGEKHADGYIAQK